jgi:hypothetical protein
MTPVSQPHCNLLLRPPAKENDCGCFAKPVKDLPAFSAHDGTVYSYWKPSLRERLRILSGVPVRLGVHGHGGHPPVSLQVEDR